MALIYRQIIGRYLNMDGSPKKGYLKFTPSSDVVNVEEAIIPINSVVMHLDDTGAFSGMLACTDSPNVVPEGWLWSIEEKMDEGEVWWMELPTEDLSPYEILSFRVPGLEPPGYAVIGPRGPQGDKGDTGSALNVVGQVANTGLLPPNENTIGDCYLVTDPIPDELWAWGTNGWEFAGESGVPGPKGDTGDTGPVGPVGPVGPPGSTGGALISGWWLYSNLETPPPSIGGIRTTPSSISIGQQFTLYIHKTDNDGLNWSSSLEVIAANDSIQLRSESGEYYSASIVSITDNVDYKTITAVLRSATSTAPLKNNPVQVSITKATTDHGSQSGLLDDDHPQYHNDTRGDARYAKLTGATMTGQLTLSGDPTAIGHATRKKYVDDKDAAHVAAADPHAQYATETYVENRNPINQLNIQTGTIDIDTDGENDTKRSALFPQPFSSVPIVLLSSETPIVNASNTAYFWVNGVTTTQVSIGVIRSNANTTRIRWVAFGLA